MNYNSYKPDGEHQYINTNHTGLICIHKDPYIFVIHDFLLDEECYFFIDKMKYKKMSNAYLIGYRQDLKYRKCLSKSIYKSYPEFKYFKNFRERVRTLTNVNENQLEVTNITRYKGDENFFKKHNDAYEYGNAFKDGLTNKEVYNRIVTVLVYLNDVNSGGETRFNDLNIDIKPKKGMALIFFPGLLPTSKKNPGCKSEKTTHEALPPKGEEKWILQQWIWSGPFIKQ